MLDYHLHLWPHTQRDAEATVEQVAAYCEKAVAAGVTEIALTEHLFRFVQTDKLLHGFWDDLPGEALRPGMAAYWDHHARVDLDSYVEVVEAVKAEGLPVVLGMEVDYYEGRMDEVAGLLADYPFDVLLGSVHWLGAWRFDVLNDPLVMAEWTVRAVDQVWDEYTRAMEELGASGACDVYAHPDLVKVAGHVPRVPDEFYDRMAEAAAASGMAAEVSSAGWRKPVGEEYPAPPLLRRFVDLGVPLTTASDAHSLPDVAHRADDLRALLAGVGVSELRGFRERRPHAVPVAGPGAPAGEAPGPGPGGASGHGPGETTGT
ncbi:MAG TPA: PHP domain-containing protein [Acidimicrobiales bacterium]|nr:PHP domain-containing protein [Acidimicrobiales bacterium]